MNFPEKPKVLIIEDDPSTIRRLAETLGDPFDILIATSESEALRLVEVHPDIILLDLYLHDRKSLDLLAQFKERENLRDIPTLCLTSSDIQEDIESAFASGAIDYIIKPFNAIILLSKVRTFIDLHRKTQILKEETFKDSLTNLANRRLLNRQLELEWRRMGREQRDLGLIMLDLDGFKALNDSEGHAAGDEALKVVSELLSGCVSRASDIIARLGGDEFVVLLPGTNLAETVRLAELIRKAIEAEFEKQKGNSNLSPLTATLGCASMIPEPSTTSDLLLSSADSELYRAKRSGKNRVSPATETAG